MKKIFCFATLLGFVNLASAQNVFPTAAGTSVGIGTITPAEQLEVTNPTTGAIRISSLKSQILANDVIGKLNFYKVDASTGGAGVATSIQSRAYDLGGAFDMDMVTGSVSTPVTAMTFHYNGNIGIGTNNPFALLHLNAINAIPNSRGNAFISTTDVAAIDVGGQLSFGGSFTGTAQTYWAGIAGRKENTTDNDYSGYLQFITRKNGISSVERMRLTSDGNLGIGITTPGLKTHIFGITGFPATTGTAQTGVLRLQGSSSQAVLDFGVNGASGSYLQATNQTALTANYPLLLNPNGGSVGIGSTTPQTALEVKSGIVNIPAPLTGGIASFGRNGHASISIVANPANKSSIYFANTADAYAGGILYDNATNTMAFRTNNISDQFIINATGSVGIGTTAPPTGYKLAVNGNVLATAVTVKLYSEWSDYVFDKDYKLPTLSQVKNYIDKNHHLPDMPSAKEVKDNGLNLGEMNALLTKKIEELTLYLIEQNKRIEKLEARLNK